MTVLTLVLPRPTIDEAAFQHAISRLACGVAVVACWQGGAPRGLLVKALTALSTRPPRVLFCVDKTAGAHDALLAAEACSLNLLSESDRAEAERFSRGDLSAERFAAERWRLAPDGPPERLGALAALKGFIEQKIDAGSHSIFIVRVESADIGQEPPLVYFDQAFHGLSAARS